jgi:hypothetical protein
MTWYKPDDTRMTWYKPNDIRMTWYKPNDTRMTWYKPNDTQMTPEWQRCPNVAFIEEGKKHHSITG